MATSRSGWCLIESDPGVFSSLVERIGVKGVSFAEVYGLDEESFASLETPDTHRKVLGFIFLFNWARDKGTTTGNDARPTVDPTSDDAPFFAAQVSNPCCGLISSFPLSPSLSIKGNARGASYFICSVCPFVCFCEDG